MTGPTDRPVPDPDPAAAAAPGEPLLRVRGLRTWFFTSAGVVKAVDGVDLAVRRGEIVGLVGESGSGKSVTSLSVMRLVDEPGRIVDGSITFDGEDLLAASNAEMRALRGSRIGMIFQQPISSLNPSYRVGYQIAEVYEAHEGLKRSVGWERAYEMLARVGIAEPRRRARAYPHEVSGGQAQRVMIAMALAGHPDLLIADEPTTALDVTIQSQILDLILDLQADLGMSVVLITHDLGIVAEVCDRVAVMYAGQIVEEAATTTLFRDPKHPYTVGLIGSVPVIGQRRDRLDVIPGRVPDLIDLPGGCRFAPRCRAREEHGLTRCFEELPALVEVTPGHTVRCFLHSDAAEAPAEVAVEVGRR
ncbi:MAG TPA: ABC transporter ATP-binding protein [Acidimicrobiales bacterium]|nr:ABC transporter ATP-binding protein [Acidimicrobiales bacterium]